MTGVHFILRDVPVHDVMPDDRQALCLARNSEQFLSVRQERWQSPSGLPDVRKTARQIDWDFGLNSLAAELMEGRGDDAIQRKLE